MNLKLYTQRILVGVQSLLGVAASDNRTSFIFLCRGNLAFVFYSGKGRRQNSHIQTTYKPQKVLCEVTYFSPNHHNLCGLSHSLCWSPLTDLGHISSVTYVCHPLWFVCGHRKGILTSPLNSSQFIIHSSVILKPCASMHHGYKYRHMSAWWRLNKHTYIHIAGWGYYHISKAMQDTNTVQEQATCVMCDSNTFPYVRPLFLMALRIS